tara:strand:- start:22 stop:687 length:666 start_codon:yes stop_codon:yes gene_type:complete
MIGKIYKITPHNQSEFYIGSTMDMKHRENTHRVDVENGKSLLYNKIRECDGFFMTLLYEYECENKTELKQEEQRAIDKLKPTLNMVRAYCSEEDIYIYNKTRRTEKIVCECGMEMGKVKLKQHKSRNIHKQNMEELNLYGRLLTSEERKRSEANVLKKKEYNNKNYQANRDKALEKSHQYNKDNAEKIKERMDCECGKNILKISINRHKKSKYHINFIENK